MNKRGFNRFSNVRFKMTEIRQKIKELEELEGELV